ncbi:restriction endonuclease, partial [Dehalococcoidales bacterium]|nr:restriction endonuclease [Dehalococcoidales bacterium]
PGQPDYTRGRVKAEVKNWQKPVHSGVVKKAKQNGVTEIVSSSGFTQPAIDEAKKAGITLISRGKRLT